MKHDNFFNKQTPLADVKGISVVPLELQDKVITQTLVVGLFEQMSKARKEMYIKENKH